MIKLTAAPLPESPPGCLAFTLLPVLLFEVEVKGLALRRATLGGASKARNLHPLMVVEVVGPCFSSSSSPYTVA